jgi:hypothetical protein
MDKLRASNSCKSSHHYFDSFHLQLIVRFSLLFTSVGLCSFLGENPIGFLDTAALGCDLESCFTYLPPELGSGRDVRLRSRAFRCFWCLMFFSPARVKCQ